MHEHTRTCTHTAHTGVLMQAFQDKGSAGHRLHTHHTHIHTHTHTHARAYTHCTHADADVSRQRQDWDNSPAVNTLSHLSCPSKTLFCKTLFFFKHSPSPWASRNVLWYWNPPSPLPTVLAVLFFLCFMCRLCVTVGYCCLSWPDHLKSCLISMTHSSVNKKKPSLTSGSQSVILPSLCQ